MITSAHVSSIASLSYPLHIDALLDFFDHLITNLRVKYLLPSVLPLAIDPARHAEKI